MTESENLSGDGTADLLEAHYELPPPDSVHTSDYNYTQRLKLNVKIFEFSRQKFPDLRYNAIIIDRPPMTTNAFFLAQVSTIGD